MLHNGVDEHYIAKHFRNTYEPGGFEIPTPPKSTKNIYEVPKLQQEDNTYVGEMAKRNI